MEYCIDTSVYVQAHRTYYAFDLAPAFWTALLKFAEQGQITSPQAVYTELMNGKDELAQWAKENRKSSSNHSTFYRQSEDTQFVSPFTGSMHLNFRLDAETKNWSIIRISCHSHKDQSR